MDRSSNFFVGSIPDSFGQLNMVTYLNLSHNTFKGSIPRQLKKLKGLESLDLSFNNLSSNIPMFLANFTFLTTLNLSFNRLEGKIPEGGIFTNLTLQSLIGNAELCGALRLHFPSCLDRSHPRKLHLLQFLLPTLTLFFGIIAICILWVTKIHKKGGDTTSLDSTNVIGHQIVSHH